MTEPVPITAGDERWPRIAVGLTLASLASGYTLALEIVLPEALSRGHLPGVGVNVLGVFLLAGLLAFPVICLLAALPAVYVISLAEARRWRSAAFYAAAGAGVALLWAGILLLLARGPSAGGPPTGGAPVAGALAFAIGMLVLPGLVGGLVYWWVAGRTAGASRAPEEVRGRAPI